MKAKDFIEKFGIDVAKNIIVNAPEWATQYDHEFDDYGDSEWDHVIRIESAVYINDLKQYTDAWELVNKFGGVVGANMEIDITKNGYTFALCHGDLNINLEAEIRPIREAIQLVESIEVKK